MHFNTFMDYHEQRDQIKALNEKRYWVSCIYASSGHNLIKNVPPQHVEFEIDSVRTNLRGFPRFGIYKVGKKGQKLTTVVKFRDSNSNYIHIFNTEQEAKDNYNRMLDDIKNDVNTERQNINIRLTNFENTVDNYYLS